MFYKLFNEEGEYIDKKTGENRNLLECNIIYTPEGINYGWKFFNTKEEAEIYYNIEKKPLN
jgi:hypothetical protein